MRVPFVRLLGFAVLLVAFPLLVIIPTVRSADPSTNRFTWMPRSDAPIDRVEGIGARVGDALYVLSGFQDQTLTIARQVDIYHLNEDRWTANVSEMPGAGVTHINPAVEGTNIWIAGGFEGDHPGLPVADVWRYDTVENAWFPGPALPEVRSGGSLVLAGRRLHYIGGFAFRDWGDDPNNTRTTHWVLDLDQQAAGWQTLAPLPEPLGHLSAVELDGTIYTVGGQIRHDRNPEDLASVYAYDIATDTWEARASLPTPRSHTEPGTLVADGRILVVGGRDNTRVNGPYDLNLVTMYDPQSDVWLDLPELPFQRIAPIAVMQEGVLLVTHGGETWNIPERVTISGMLDNVWEDEHPDAPVALGAAGGAMIGQRMFVIGAEDTATLAFDLGQGTWEPIDTHPPRPLATRGSAVEAFAGSLYVFGGVDAAAQALQIYDPQAQSWREGAELPFAAEDAAAVAIGEFIYVVMDGQAARYAPETDRWEPLPAGPPTPVRSAAAGTDGKLFYLFGGETAGAATAMVQRYDPATGEWLSSSMPDAPLASLPAPQTAGGRVACSGGVFYLLGGQDAAGAALATSLAYDIAAADWRDVAAAPAARSGAAQAMIADRFYVAGGVGADSAASATITVYNAPTTSAAGETCATPAPAQPGEETYLPLLRR